MFRQHVKQLAEFGPRLIQRHLDEHRLRAVDLVQRAEQPVEVFRLAERFADIGVRAGDVDFNHRRVPGRPAHRRAVVFDAFIDVSAQFVVRSCDGHGHLHTFRLIPCTFGPRNNPFAAVVGKPDMDDHRIVFRQPVEPWLRIARARACGGRANRFKAESGVVEQHRHVAVLVEAGGQTEGVIEMHAHHIGFENRIGVVEHFAQKPHERRNIACDTAEFNHLVVCHVRCVVEHEERLDDVLVAESEKVGGRLVDGVVQRLFGNVTHASYCGTVVSVFATNAGTVSTESNWGW